MRVDYAIIYVSDMKHAVKFYRDVLQLPLRLESPGWTEFATEGATIALHESDPVTNISGRCRPGLSVLDLTRFHERMLDYRVTCLREPERLMGVRIAQYEDPDGLGISVSEIGGRR
jgi:lactoylglutathione lyase